MFVLQFLTNLLLIIIKFNYQAGLILKWIVGLPVYKVLLKMWTFFILQWMVMWSRFGQANNNIGQANNNIGQANNNIGQANNNIGQANNNIGQVNNNIGQANNNIGQANNNIGQTIIKFDQTCSIIHCIIELVKHLQ